VGQSVASIVNVVQGEAGQVKMFLRADYVDIFSVVDYFTDEWHILETEQSNLALYDLLGAAQCVLCCPVKCSLAEH